jgi:type II secretion system protein N
MIQRIAIVVAGLAWAFLVFLCTGYLSFPGDAVAERAEVEVKAASRGAYELELNPVSPWWLGLSTDSLKLYGRADREGVNPLLALATDARVSASPLSLLAREPYISGSVTLGTDGLLAFEVGTAADGDRLKPTVLKVDSDAFPVAELLALTPMEGSGTGNLAIHIDLSAADGMAKADGDIQLLGQALTLVQPVIAGMPLGRDVEIRDLDLEFDADQGKAKVRRGRIQTDIANVDITGTITLADPLDRSTVDLRVEAELDESMAAFRSMLKSAEVNGKLVWRCTGRVNALARGCSPGEGRRASRARTPSPRNTAGRDGARRTRPEARTRLSAEEREARRKELQEKLKKRREQRRKDRAERAASRPEPTEDDPVDDGEDLPLDDEPLDELPPEDDEGLDDPPPDDEEFLEDE